MGYAKKPKKELITYQDQVYLDALQNKEKREAIVASDEPYICPKCSIAKHPKDFVTQYMNNHLVWKYRWLYECKTCKKNRIYLSRLGQRNTLKWAIQLIYKQSSQSAKQRNLEHTLRESDIITMRENQDGKCYYSWYTMEYEFIGYKNDTFSERVKYQVSIDRKDNTLWYTKNNCVLCCTLINKMKNILDEKEFIQTCKDIIARSTN